MRLRRILDHVAHDRIPSLGVRVEVVEVRENFGVFPGSLNNVLDLVVFVGIVNGAALEDREFMAVGGGSF